MTTSDEKPTELYGDWNWHPQVPLKLIPYWAWPPQPVALAGWLWTNFLQVSDRAIFIALALIIGFWFMPVTENQADFTLGWISAVVVRNFILVGIVAGGLHL
jgi:lathosterol oxidase